METVRKIGAVVVMVLAVLGVLAMAVGLIGAWSYKDEVTAAATTTASAINKAATLGEWATGQSAEALGQVGRGLSTAQSTIAERVADRQAAVAEARAAARERYGPTISAAIQTARATSDAIIAFNDSLEALNRIPGVELRTLTAEIGEAQDRLAAAEARVQAIGQAIDEVLPDGTPIQDALGQGAADADAAASALADYSARLNAAATTAAGMVESLPRTINLIVWGLSGLFLLLAAGQISLFIHALGWFRRPAA